MMKKIQTLGLQAQPCYKSTLKSLFDLLGKSLHLFCKDCNGILECGVFSLVVCDGCRGGDDDGGRSGQWSGDGTSGGSVLCGWLSLKAGETYPGEVASAAAVIADRRAGVLFQAVFMQLGATATTAILHPFAPLLDDVFIGQSLEVGINVVGINVHHVRIMKARGRARSWGWVVTSSTYLALVVLQVSDL
jgi:hypothetical protein